MDKNIVKIEYLYADTSLTIRQKIEKGCVIAFRICSSNAALVLYCQLRTLKGTKVQSHHFTNKNIIIYRNMINFRFFCYLCTQNSLDMAEHSINRIKVALAEQNKTNRWLAEQMGKSEITISRWVQNKAQPSLEQLLQIARIYP